MALFVKIVLLTLYLNVVYGTLYFHNSSDNNITFQEETADPMLTISGDARCTIDEGEEGDSACEYYIEASIDIQFEDIKIDFKEDATKEVKESFEFRIERSPDIETQKGIIILSVLQNLDYDIFNLYIFHIYAEDKDGNKSNDLQIVIELNDIPNKLPLWVVFEAIQLFEEHKSQNIIIKAIDGDLQLDEEIVYSLTSVDPIIFTSKISLKNENGEGQIVVGDIDREEFPDSDNNNLIWLTLLATEKDSGDEISGKMVLIIEDIDDNSPVISLLDTKSIEICEHTNELISLLQINDIDLGDNARYSVDLVDKKNEKYLNAFRVFPGSGYQTSNFALLVSNSELIDYDTSNNWHDFSLYIQAVAQTGRYNVQQEIKIKLINWNDNAPMFPKNVYEVEIAETVEDNYEIVQISVSDADGDYMIDFSLTSLSNIMKIENMDYQSARITTIGRIFDFETQPFVVFQVVATDSFPVTVPSNDCPERKNQAYATVQVTIKDINDESPVLTVDIKDDIIVDANQTDGTVINLGSNIITANDKDATAVLDFTINWDVSRATKAGRVVKTDWKNCLAVRGIPSGQGHFNVEFSIIENKPGQTPDYKQLDKMYIVLRVTDNQTQYGPPSVEATIIMSVNNANDYKPTYVVLITVGIAFLKKSL